MDEGNTITLKIFDTLPEAEFAKDALDQNGVQCFLSNEYGSQLYPIFGSSISGVHLHVFEADAARAQEILDGLYFA